MNFNTVCRCCLVRPPDKDLKSVYTCQGKTEVYGDMLNECFEIHLPIEPCDSENGICELCIARLRDASDFKHQVLQCQKEFQIKLTTSSDIKDEDMLQTKEEYLDIEENDISALDEDMPQTKEEYLDIEENDISALVDDTPQIKEEYLDVEENDISALVEDTPQIKEEYLDVEENDISALAEEKRQENAGELEVEKLSFVNQDYPGWDPFSASGSSDEDQPTTFQKPQNIELEPRQLQVDTVLPTTEEHQSQAADCNGSVGKDQKKCFCFYCETHVLNFSRHIIRNHYLEVDVKKILALPKKSQIRRNLIIQLKKRGNYISNLARCERPMKLEKYLNESDYLPYQNCLGFYPRKQLWTHNNKGNPEALGAHMQAEAQNLMCLNSPHTPSIILQKVFSRMRADEISFVVKQDALICKFGENHTKRHVGEHFINVISSKMRQLAKIFIEIQKIKPDIRTFVDALSSQNYNVLIAAAKAVAKYDENLHRYCSPTIAMNICTSIKQCCNIAITEILKMKPSIKYAEKQADLKTLVQLIESNWTSDVLNLNKWNKVTIVTLASDLKLLKNHLCSTAQNAAVQLKDENIQDIGAYKLLAETIFCRILLLNRLRPGQLQSLSLRTYVKNEHKEYQYEEIHHTLTATEKILFQRLKCVVIRGKKRSSGVPVLISTDVQQDLDLLISLREKYIYVSNKFLFAKPSARTFLCGYGVLQKHVKLSGAKNPDAISSTKLKKYLATLTQLFNMTKNDVEQLTNYLGYTAGVNTQNYRLHGNIFQTAKLSKLLMLIEDGQADLFKGKSLDEININMDEDLEVEGLQREENLDFAENENTLQESDMVADLSTTTVLVPETTPMNHL